MLLGKYLSSKEATFVPGSFFSSFLEPDPCLIQKSSLDLGNSLASVFATSSGKKSSITKLKKNGDVLLP